MLWPASRSRQVRSTSSPTWSSARKPPAADKSGAAQQEIAGGEIEGIAAGAAGHRPAAEIEARHHRFVAIEGRARVHAVDPAADRRHLRRRKGRQQFAQPLLRSGTVRIDKGEDFTRSGLRPPVAGRGRTAADGAGMEQLRPEFLGDLRGVVAAAVIDDDDLQPLLGIIEGSEGLQTMAEIDRPVLDRDDDADLRQLGLGQRRPFPADEAPLGESLQSRLFGGRGRGDTLFLQTAGEAEKGPVQLHQAQGAGGDEITAVSLLLDADARNQPVIHDDSLPRRPAAVKIASNRSTVSSFAKVLSFPARGLDAAGEERRVSARRPAGWDPASPPAPGRGGEFRNRRRQGRRRRRRFPRRGVPGVSDPNSLCQRIPRR